MIHRQKIFPIGKACVTDLDDHISRMSADIRQKFRFVAIKIYKSIPCLRLLAARDYFAHNGHTVIIEATDEFGVSLLKSRAPHLLAYSAQIKLRIGIFNSSSGRTNSNYAFPQ
jgi:hypothetical protein